MERLGSGGVSEVFRAKDRFTNRDVALKILHPHLTEFADRLEREVETTRAVDHPRIARYYELCRTPERVYLSLEYLPGGDLRQHIIERGAMPVGEVVRIGIEVLDGLAAAHSAGIIHCDIKPHNVLLDDEGHVRLTDFGLARTSAGGSLSQRSRAGTPDYVAPEISTGGYFDARSDLYSFGVMLFEMLTGKPPYQSNTVHQTLWKHVHADPPSVRELRSDAPEVLDEIVRKALAKEPSDRFQSAEAFADALGTMTAPVALPIPAAHRCPACGESVLDALPYCLHCGNEEAVPTEPPRGDPRYRIAVTGPGKPGDRLDPELREALLRYLEAAGCTSRALERHIPRLPFVLLRDLSEESATAAKRALERLGLKVETAGRNAPDGAKALFRALNRKTLALYPRILMIGMGCTGSMWWTMGRAAQGVARSGLTGVVAAVGFILIGVPIIIRASTTRTKARRKEDAPVPAGAALVPTTREIQEPAVRRLLARIAGKLETLRGILDERRGEPEAELGTRELLDSVIPSLQNAARRIADLEKALRDLSIPGGIAGTDADEVIGVKRKVEGTIQLYIDRILRFSVELDRLSVDLAGANAQEGIRLLRRLEGAAESVSVEAAAHREMETTL